MLTGCLETVTILNFYGPVVFARVKRVVGCRLLKRECLMVDLGWGTRLGRNRAGASAFDEENPTCP